LAFHASADGPLWANEPEAFRRGRAEGAVLLSTARPQDYTTLKAINPDMDIVVRLFVAFMDGDRQRNIPPEQFFQDTVNDVRAFWERGARKFKLHNEPNLDIEGYTHGPGLAWAAGTAARPSTGGCCG
jgi:hypothetical protein